MPISYIVATLVIVLSLVLQLAPASLIAASGNTTQPYQAGELLVKFIDSDTVHRIKTDHNADITSLVEKYQNNQAVEFVEPNYIVQATAFPNDVDISYQWYLNAINIRPAWSKELLIREAEKINRTATIAVIDTGVDLDHPDLVSKIWTNSDEIANNGIDDDHNSFIDDSQGWDFVNDDRDANPLIGTSFDASAVKHGTIVAGIAAATNNNTQGIAGVGWFAQIMPLRVLDSNGAGDVFAVVRAIDYAVANGADVINMSFVGSGFSQSLFEAISRANDNDIVVVAAAGNTDPAVNGINLNVEKAYPVCYDGSPEQNMVIGVAAVGHNFTKSGFSNYGECIDLVAPGESIWSTQVFATGFDGFSKYYDGFWSGTSLAAPQVSGTAAMLRSLRPGFSASEIRDFIIASAKNIDVYNPTLQGQLGSGILDTLQALEFTLDSRVPQTQVGQNNYVVASLGYGSFPQLKVLKTDGSVFKEFFAYSPNFTGPINIATGDINSDGKEEVITGAGIGGGPHVRVFNIEGQVMLQFFAYNASSRGGVTVAVANVTGDSDEEIITGAGKGQEPVVKVFDRTGKELYNFLVYAEGFTGGVKVAAGDFDHDGKAEIVTGAGAGGGPHVRVFKPDGVLVSQFFAYNQNVKGGVNIAVGDVHGDGQDEIIATIESNSVPTVRVFNFRGAELHSFFAYDPNMLSGVQVAVDDIDNDNIAEIITGPGRGESPFIKIFDRFGALKHKFFAHGQSGRTGAQPAVLPY